MKTRNPKVRVSAPLENGEPVNPYKRGTAKNLLFEWALQQGEFTKEEFLKAHAEIFELHKIPTVMTIEVCGKAWWNEFANKHEVFVSVE